VDEEREVGGRCPVNILCPVPGKCYYWKSSPAYRLALYNDLDHNNPIATYQPTPGYPGTIDLQRDAEGIIDALVISFLILEQNMRMTEKVDRLAQMKRQVRGTVTAGGQV